jgi:hypothetical protein
VNDQILQDGAGRTIVRVGDTVRRPVYPWSASVHALLEHLEAVGFGYSPRFLGIDEQGREILTYLPGESGADGWAKVVDEDGLRAFGRLLREYHDAVAGYRPDAGTVWSTGAGGFGVGESAADHVVCHGDFGPWNVVWDGTRPVGIVDWDHARPAPRLWDVAYAAQYCCPFRDDETCVRWLRYQQAPDRRRRLRILSEAYGLPSPAGIADEVLRQQSEDVATMRDFAARGIEPQATWVREGHLEELAGRSAWSRSHRGLFDG